MRVTVKRLYDSCGNETGAILRAPRERSSDLHKKLVLESLLIQYSVVKLYPHEQLNVYRDTYAGVPSITVIKEAGGLMEEDMVL
ncbi:MAG: hypothetical protein KIS94_12350 [Chitinophagales bacterium]|nr:hypothetical protein [Chitinophagales bacterium]